MRAGRDDVRRLRPDAARPACRSPTIHYERFDYADDVRSAKDRRRLAGFAAIGAAVAAAVVAFSLA